MGPSVPATLRSFHGQGRRRLRLRQLAHLHRINSNKQKGLPMLTRFPGSRLLISGALSLTVLATAVTPANGDAGSEPVTAVDAAAPVISRQDLVIQAPVSTVWAVQTDISRWPAWRPSVPAAQLDGELKAGAVFRWEEAGLKITSTVQQVMPERRLVWTGPAQGIFAVHVWEFTPVEGGTRVHTEESWTGAPVDAQAAQLQPLLDGALKEWLSRLKQASEARVVAPR